MQLQVLHKTGKGEHILGRAGKDKRRFCQMRQHIRGNLLNQDFFLKIDKKNHLQVYKINLIPLGLQKSRLFISLTFMTLLCNVTVHLFQNLFLTEEEIQSDSFK